ncbi:MULTISPECIES: glycosyl hydrolase-related protein [Microbacterium]|uniref:glycosyl hydrolase-related protein n=2 Tax=Microbacteriaceae TaxID=85023 RepID=UPI0027D79FBF|nr:MULTISPECIES: glycosyl hydrolase-related protein [Microbacterium]
MFPDPGQDQGVHHLEVGIVVEAEVVDAVAEGYRTNLPARVVTDAAEESVAPLVTIDQPGVVVEAIKLAQDGSGDVVVRLYEALGQRVHARLEAGFYVARVSETDLLERDVDAAAVTAVQGGVVDLELRPFQLVTVRLSR